MDVKLLAAVIVVLLVVSLITFFAFQGPAFTYEEESVVFYSEEADPVELIKSFRDKARFVVVGEIVEQSIVGQFTSGMINVATIAAAKGKGSVFLLKNYTDGVFSSCSTNKGDVYTVAELTAEECDAYLNDFPLDNTVFIVFEAPDSSLKKVNVYVSSSEMNIVLQDARQASAFGEFVSESVFGDLTDVKEAMARVLYDLGSKALPGSDKNS
ncbi:MAG: hypothetical protein GOV15_02455, partial [Candidatus Diapherotrites archaeon]|nr:hypothetical protein [Candidatus Diapherotrites archaeon]